MIVNRITEWAHRQPDKAALIHQDVAISYADFARAIEASRKFFAGQDLPPRRNAIVVAESLADAWVFALGLRAFGLNTCCMSASMLSAMAEFKNVGCVVVSASERASVNIPAWADRDRKLVTVPKAIYRNIQAEELPRAPAGPPVFGGQILLTSGTTGTSKKVLMAGRMEEGRNQLRAAQMSFDRDSVVHLQNFPLWTSVGFKVPSCIWHQGGSVVIDQRPDRARRFFGYKLTHGYFSPPALQSVLQEAAPLIGKPDFLVGGGFVPLESAQQVTERWNARLWLSLSTTEIGPLVMNTEFRDRDDVSWYAPVTGRVIRIVNAHGDDCATGEEGRLGIGLTDLDCNGYLDDDEPDENVFADGMFFSGDLAVRRSDGRIRVLGRLNDVVNIGGKQRPVAPIEHAIQALLRVDEVCLLNRAGDDEIIIAIQAAQTPPQSELDAIVSQFGFDRVRFVVLKEFPRAKTGMGKVWRSELRKCLLN